MATTQPEDPLRIEVAIKNRGIPHLAARHLAHLVLSGWSTKDVIAVLDKVDGLQRGFQNLKTVDRTGSWTKPSSWRWVQASFDLMQQAARESKVLCVNAQGEFALRGTDYIAISHASIEGLFEDPSNRGLPQSVIVELFKVLAPVKAQWIWIDSLSIPAGQGDLSVAEEQLKNELINMMGSIYGKATCVVALDAVVMHLQSDDPVDIGIAIMTGRWARRLWCYQEGRFAKQLIFITNTGPIDLHSLIYQIEQLPPSPTKQVMDLIEHLWYLAPGGQVRPTLTSTASTFFAREAGLQIDYARSLYPIFGIPWEKRFVNRDEAMARIYRAYPDEAVELICSFGPRRLVRGPGWAPAWITQTVVQPVNGLTWGSGGISGRWYIYKVRAAGRGPNASHLTVKDGDSLFGPSIEAEIEQHGETVVKLRLIISTREDQVSIHNYLEVSKSGNAHLLSPEPLRPLVADLLHEGRIVLLAERTSEAAQDPVFQVHMTAMIGIIEEIEPTVSQDIRITHSSPRWRSPSTGTKFEEAQRAMCTTIDKISIPFETALHRAIRQQNHSRAFQLISDAASTEQLVDLVSARDSIGWTPLHWAIFQRSKRVGKLVTALIQAGANLNAGDEKTRSPLHLALEMSTNDVCHILLNNGADPNTISQGINTLALAIHFHRDESLIRKLLGHGADPNACSSHSFPPLAFAWQRGDLSTVRLLLEHKANADAHLHTGLSLLHEAAFNESVRGLHILVEGGANVNARTCEKVMANTNDSDSSAVAAEPAYIHRTPLELAVGKSNMVSIEALVQHGADVNARSTAGWPLITLAAAHSTLDVTRLLLRANAKADTSTTKEGWTALHVAARKADFSLVNLLLEADVSKDLVFRKDSEGLTPRDHALKLGKQGSNVDRVLFRRMQWERYGWYTTPTAMIGLLLLCGPVLVAGVWWQQMQSRNYGDEERRKGGPGDWWSSPFADIRGESLLLVMMCTVLPVVATIAMARSKWKAKARARMIERWENRAPSEMPRRFWTGIATVLFTLYTIATWYWGSVLDREGGTAYTLAVSFALALVFFRFDRVQEAEARKAIVALVVWLWLVALESRIWPHIVRLFEWTGWRVPVMVLLNGIPAHCVALVFSARRSGAKNLTEWLIWLYRKGTRIPILFPAWIVVTLPVLWLGWTVIIVTLEMLTVLELAMRQKLIRHFGIEIALPIVFPTATAAVLLSGSIAGTVGCIITLLIGLPYLIVVLRSKFPRFKIPRLGTLVSAEQKYLWTLAVKDKALGRDHTSTLSTVSNLGNLYRTQGKLSEAEQMYVRLLAGYERAMGHDHISTLTILNYLGNLYRSQGKPDKAEQTYVQALAGSEQALGSDRILTLNIASNLGLLYSKQGKKDEAERMYIRALAGYERAVGRGHKLTLRTLNLLASLYKHDNKLAALIGLATSWAIKSIILFGHLGRLLLQSADETNAQIAFWYQHAFHNGSTAYVTCDGCDRGITSITGRAVCRRCADVDICQDCFNKHDAGTETRTPRSCAGHSFYSVVLPGSDEEQDAAMEEMQAAVWLRDLAIRYPHTDGAQGEPSEIGLLATTE